MLLPQPRRELCDIGGRVLADTLENVDRTAAAAFASHLASLGTRAKTRKNIIDDLSTVWEALKRTRPELDNPWPIVRPQVNDSERGQPFTREQEKEVLKAAKAAGSQASATAAKQRESWQSRNTGEAWA